MRLSCCITNVLSRSQFKIILQGRQLSSILETHSAASVSVQPIVPQLAQAGTPFMLVSTLLAISLVCKSRDEKTKVHATIYYILFYLHTKFIHK